MSKSSLILFVYKADCSALYTIYIDPKKPQTVLHSKVAESIKIQKWDKSKFYSANQCHKLSYLRCSADLYISY